MGLLDSLGVKTVDEAAVKLGPILDEAEDRLVNALRKALDGATITIHLAPAEQEQVKE